MNEAKRSYGAATVARSTAITAAIARSILRVLLLCSLARRCPRESTFSTALPMWRASRRSPSWLSPRLATSS